MYESHRHALAKPAVFARRLVAHLSMSGVVVALSLAAGVLGYHALEGLSIVDAFLNAAMLMGGMGPVDPPHSTAGKLFAALYALYCGLVLLIAAGIVLAPFFHRMLHHFHLDSDGRPRKDGGSP